MSLANMFGIRIATFTYNIKGQPPRWTWTSPDQYISSYSQHKDVERPDMWLFHKDDCHYDLLVPREVVQLHRAAVPEVSTSLSQPTVQHQQVQPTVQHQQVPATHHEPDVSTNLAQPINLSSAEEIELSVDRDSLPTPPPPRPHTLRMESCKS